MARPSTVARAAVRAARRLRAIARHLPDVARSAAAPTLYPDAARKGRARILAEHARHLLLYGEPDERYYVYGLDRRGVRLDSVLDYPEFRRLRDRGHTTVSASGMSYACVMRDKYLFGLVAAALDQPAPRTLAVLDGDVEWVGQDQREPLDSLAEQDIDGFCKPFDGISSRGAFAFRTGGGTVEIDGQRSSLPALRALLTGRYLLQERVVQHPDLARLHPPSVNTLRVHTVLEGGRARAFSVILRMGRGGRTSDGLGAGGIGVSVGLATGRLAESGLVRVGSDAGWYRCHPETGVEFASFEVPFFGEAVAAACRFHEGLPFFHTLGWDIAVTENGPLFVEGNDNWGGTAGFSIEPGFRDVFLSLYPPVPAGSTR